MELSSLGYRAACPSCRRCRERYRHPGWWAWRHRNMGLFPESTCGHKGDVEQSPGTIISPRHSDVVPTRRSLVVHWIIVQERTFDRHRGLFSLDLGSAHLSITDTYLVHLLGESLERSALVIWLRRLIRTSRKSKERYSASRASGSRGRPTLRHYRDISSTKTFSRMSARALSHYLVMTSRRRSSTTLMDYGSFLLWIPTPCESPARCVLSSLTDACVGPCQLFEQQDHQL